MSDSSTPSSAWDEENWWPVMLIMLQRIYDLQLAMLSAINSVKAAEVVQLHERGQTFAPMPKFAVFEESEDGTST